MSRALPTVLVLLIPFAAIWTGPLSAQSAAESGAERFAPLNWLVGEWQGYGLFADDTSYIRKQYRYVLGGMFLIEETIDIFPPAEITTDYQIHQDWGVYYAADEGYALKGFFVEGFVWNAQVSVQGDTVRVVTRSVESGPPGLGARVTTVRKAEDRYEATFEIGSAERGYRLVETLHMRRVSGG